MEKALVELITARVNERFQNETEFYQSQLGLTHEEWENWKRGVFFVSEKGVAAMIQLFTDYEWMLIQKVIRQTKVIPEKEQGAVDDFNKMKLAIAKKWMTSELATVDLVERLQEVDKLTKTIELRIILSYDAWGYSDILTFTFPAVERDKVAGSRRELIQYMTSLEKRES
ncbi:hypothetical protein SAMN02745116_01339 [Pilibacter termitis]|jgi:hypothetical protein|uniref:Uncharacterized protein n=1 Tax=Pilibacter termitis TaxID=263852 RepID=A0A1T4N7Z0_9ENTE|nr:hypothetical protein [Pilibacter termitis]SJZ75344.1 hypothetical protein SAMN02745116_01339 [Pilibacter termitis]